MNARRTATVGVVAGVLAVGFPLAAQAQLSASASLLSDYRFRGVSLSSENPAAQADINYDTASGWFAGAFASTVKFDAYSGVDRLLLTHAGYAHRLAPELSVDAGLSYANFSAGDDLDYLEAHAGVTSRFVNVQLAFAPKYFGGSRTATYLEANSGTQLTASLRLFGHLGVFYMRPQPPLQGRDTQLDGRVGVRYEYGAFSAQLSQVAVSRISGIYPVGYSQRRSATVLELTLFF